MKILFITAHKYLPQMYGGAQSSTDQLCQALLKRGHRVSVLAGLMPGGWFELKSKIEMQIRQRVTGCKIARNSALGYPVWYAWHPWEAVEHVAGSEKPDIIVVLTFQSVRMALAAKPTGIPLLVQCQDVEFHEHGGDFKQLGQVSCVTNSQFTAAKYRDAFGVNPAVIFSFILAEKYRTVSTRENVTFINPHPKKGRDIAVEVARRSPHIPFVFVEAWPLSPQERQELMQMLAGLSNVTLLPPQSDMRSIYGKCKILLAPSVWEEAYGRVATEAQISGIPVIGSIRGGLPEAIGAGGILLDPAGPIDGWIRAVSGLWKDEQRYDELSRAARIHGTRPEIGLAHQIDAWERLLWSVKDGVMKLSLPNQLVAS